ncbi:MAG: HNH endonuclease [Chitinophagaceae bacterium]|nr:HNH endonuclease [Chitinophagaceae bacterium]
MVKEISGEIWKKVEFGNGYVNDLRVEVSNFGRLRSFHILSKGKILKGSMVTGYLSMVAKLQVDRDEATKKKFAYHQQQIDLLLKQLKAMKMENVDVAKQKELETLLNGLQANYRKEVQQDLSKRTTHMRCLVHRLVAEYFLPPPGPDQVVVAHLDFDKLNNRFDNLKWMTRKENLEHQKNSPYVQHDHTIRKQRRNNGSKQTKLTVTQVMFMKKLLKEGKPVKLLAKRFKVSEMQVFRIKRGENWSDITI